MAQRHKHVPFYQTTNGKVLIICLLLAIAYLLAIKAYNGSILKKRENPNSALIQSQDQDKWRNHSQYKRDKNDIKDENKREADDPTDIPAQIGY